MIQIPQNIQEIANYKPGKPGDDMFDGIKHEKTAILCSNENNFGTSPLAIKAIQDSLSQLYLYPDPTGDKLKTALSEYYAVPKNKLILGNGSDGILYTVFNAFFEPGEHLLTSHATFVSLKAMAKMNNVPYRTVPMASGYSFDLDGMLKAMNDKTKLIYLCNPNNPTGAMIPANKLDNFLKQVPSDKLVIVDEAYFEFSKALADDYPDSSRMGYDNVLSFRTFSKAYGLAGIRLGFGIGHEDLIATLQKVKLTFNPNLLAQAAGTAALQDKDFLQMTIQNNCSEISKFYTLFESLKVPYVPSFANFVMIDLASEERVESMYELLRQKGILTRRLASFELPHCLRISVGRPDENAWFLQCFSQIYSSFN